MRTLVELQQLARAADFRPDSLEKIYRLLRILDRLEGSELTQGQWVLKGGTAINLFYLDVPRLSVDVDINFVGVEGLNKLEAARQLFDGVVTACCGREGCSVKPAPTEHAGGKFRLRFASLLGGEQKLEVDVSYVARVPLLGIENRPHNVRGLPQGDPLPILSLQELAAGKFAALLSRGAPRDFFDALSLIERDPGLLKRPDFRIAFVCHVAASRADLRKVKAPRELRVVEVENQLLPLLRVGSSAAAQGAGALVERLEGQLRPAILELVEWSEGERRFLDRLIEHGELEPGHLTGDSSLAARIAKQPMLLWKQKNVREYRGLA